MDVAAVIRNRRREDVVACEATTPVREAVAVLAERRIGAVPVMQGGEVVGIFSERDLLYSVAREGAACLERPLAEVMTAPAITIEPQTSVLDALDLMTRRRIRHLPVCAGGELCAFVSIGDLVKSRLDEVQREAETMRTYIQMA